MDKVELCDIGSMERSNFPFCVTKDGKDLFVAVPHDVFEELLLTDSVLKDIECNERSLAEDVFKKAEEMYGKLQG